MIAKRNVAEVLRSEWQQSRYCSDLLAFCTVPDAWQTIGHGLRLNRGVLARHSGGDAWPR